ncbi:MAG: SsrA-binding protein SmpB [Gammaproteobacteria bacterium]|nr:SsrA-binding protein SmpB [Gammaproteobacteria bacterium]
MGKATNTARKPKKSTATDSTIVRNKRARHDFFIQDTFEAGLALQGWEVKSLRQKKVQLVDSYVLIKDGEAFLLGCNITPLNTASTHVVADPGRTKKLLLHKKELAKLFAATQQKGFTCVCTKLYWKDHLVKCQIGLAKGKQSHDKRATAKEREWNIDKQRIVRHHNR